MNHSPDQDPEMLRLLREIIRCPRCLATLNAGASDELFCTNSACVYAVEGFFRSSGQPVLVDFPNSLLKAETFADGRGAVLPRDDSGRGLRTMVRQIVTGLNTKAAVNIRRFCAELKQRARRPLVLIIGGGGIGDGTSSLYGDNDCRIIGTDVYASPNTQVVADGHHLPFADGTFDGVLIQAVLEHVLDPQTVVQQIARVLKPDGVVYAETPFMQQVHEGAYDFTRFTASGHRWLFRRFRQIDAGTTNGAGTTLLWAIRHFWRALGVGNKLATLFTAPFFWLQFVDRLGRRRESADGASGLYFLGAKSDRELTPSEIVAYYDTQR